MTRVNDVYLKIGSVTGNQTAWIGPMSRKRTAQVRYLRNRSALAVNC